MKRKAPGFFAPIEEIHAYNAHKARKRKRAYAGSALAGAAIVTGRAVQRRRKANSGKRRRDNKGRFT